MSQERPTTLYVNGVKVGGGGDDGGHVQKGFEIAPFLHPGRNTLAVEVQQATKGDYPLAVRTDVHESYPVRAGAPVSW